MSDVSSDERSDAISDECELLASYVDFDLSALPDLPETFLELQAARVFDLSVISENAPAFFDLLDDTPLLLSGLSADIDSISDQIIIPPSFFAPSNLMAINALAELSSDFVDVADDSCDLHLTDEQRADVRRLFGVVLPIFVVFSRECELLSRAIVEQAIADADASNVSAQAIVIEIDTAVDVRPQLISFRHFNEIQLLIINPQPPADVTAAAQSILDGFLFTINDFCGIPTLSSKTLALLDDAFLVELMKVASALQ